MGLLVAAALVAAGAPAATAVDKPMHVALYGGSAPRVPFDAAIRNVECVMGLTTEARYRRIWGFAARLTAEQVGVMGASEQFRDIRTDPGRYVITGAESAIAELERQVGFTAEVRLRWPARTSGFVDRYAVAAVLDWRQLAVVAAGPVSVDPDPGIYGVYFDGHGPADARARAAELERRYGFRTTFVATGPRVQWFGAHLTAEQLAQLAAEPDLGPFFGAGAGEPYFLFGPPDLECKRPTIALRRRLRDAYARRYGLRRAPLPRVDWARLQRREYALATFRIPGHRAPAVELFRRRTGGRWIDAGAAGKLLCGAQLPEFVAQMWLLRFAGDGCWEVLR